MHSAKNMKKKVKSTKRSPKIIENLSQEIIYHPKLPRPNSSKLKNIHTLRIKRRISFAKLTNFSNKNHRNLSIRTYNDCDNLISITTYTGRPIPYSSSNTPSCGFFEETKPEHIRAVSPSNISDDSFSGFYPSDPKLHCPEQTKLLMIDKAIGQSMKILKKIVIKKPKILVCPKEPHDKAIFDDMNRNLFKKKPFRNFSEMIPYNNRMRPKGKIKRGLCINLCKSPTPRLVHNINILSG